MQVSSLELYQILLKKFGEAEAESLLKFVEAEVKEKIDDQKDVLATKKDIADLRVEIRDVKVDTIKWIVGMALIQIAAMMGTLIAIVKFLLPH